MPAEELRLAALRSCFLARGESGPEPGTEGADLAPAMGGERDGQLLTGAGGISLPPPGGSLPPVFCGRSPEPFNEAPQRAGTGGIHVDERSTVGSKAPRLTAGPALAPGSPEAPRGQARWNRS